MAASILVALELIDVAVAVAIAVAVAAAVDAAVAATIAVKVDTGNGKDYTAFLDLGLVTDPTSF